MLTSQQLFQSPSHAIIHPPLPRKVHHSPTLVILKLTIAYTQCCIVIAYIPL